MSYDHNSWRKGNKNTVIHTTTESRFNNPTKTTKIRVKIKFDDWSRSIQML